MGSAVNSDKAEEWHLLMLVQCRASARIANKDNGVKKSLLQVHCSRCISVL